MTAQAGKWQEPIGALAALLLVAGSAYSLGSGKQEPPFQYAGGTEALQRNCRGNLELTSQALTFKCTTGSIEVRYSSITLMQYRPDLSERVRSLKPRWKVWPPSGGGKENRYFTIVYAIENVTHVIVLKVAPLSMRPYLAEMEMRSGRRVEVRGYEEYQ